MVTPASAEPLADASDFRLEAGGAESNVATHVAALGHSAAWAGRLGDDPLGHRIARQLAARHVDVSRVEFDPRHPTGVYFKDPGSAVHYYRAGSAASHVLPSSADALDLDGVRVLHLSGITAAISGTSAQFLDRLIERARSAGVTVSFDVNHRVALWSPAAAAVALEMLAGRADVVFVGRDEAELLWGTPDAAAVRARLPDVPELVVKDGDVGATAFVGADRVFAPAPAIEVLEAVGAGDAFAGGYLARLLEGASIQERLRAGHARAGLTLRTTGDSVDAHPSRQEEPV